MLESVGGVVKAASLKALRADVYQSIAGLLNDGSQRYLKKHRIGLAISGGVDSMALATICACHWHGVERGHRQDVNFSGFIVDHGYRRESADEAKKVAEQLTRLGIEPRILKLDWSAYGDPKTVANFESVARRLRYQAIGKACYQDGIRSILVAHHADDQAETVLARIFQKYFGHGLKGIKSVAKLPDCEGLYGVDGSGNVRYPVENAQSSNGDRRDRGMGVESGGLHIYRPLLRYTKDELIALCEELGVNWFEDQTNADKTLTLRNAIRHLQRASDLPKAFQRDRLVALADRILQDREKHEQLAAGAFNSLPITLDLASGEARFTLSEDILTDPIGRALVLRKLLLLVAPRTVISLADLAAGVAHVFASSARKAFLGSTSIHVSRNSALSTAQVAEVNICLLPESEAGKTRYAISRANPTRSHNSDINLCWPEQRPFNERLGPVRWSHWVLWDNRYWIRAGHFGRDPPVSNFKIAVTFLQMPHLAALRQSLPKWQMQRLQKALNTVRSELRKTIPAIVAKRVSGEATKGTGVVQEDVQIMALPSIRWNNPKYKFPDKYWEHDEEMRKKLKMGIMWIWDIRYREVDFSGPEHRFVDSATRQKPSPEENEELGGGTAQS